MVHSQIEKNLRSKFSVGPLRGTKPELFRHLMAFWQSFALHKRKCAYSGRSIISVYGSECPYPVWDRTEWLQYANPPCAEFNPSKPFFQQLWELFQQCPIPHNIAIGNENSDYTDDWWYSKNCYLCHSGVQNEDCHYCYRVINLRNCQYCVFSFDSELCSDLVNCYNCYGVRYGVNSRQCRDSAFLFDCRNCHNCLFCWNLRNQEFCIENNPVSREEFRKYEAGLNLSSWKAYCRAETHFQNCIQEKVFWRAYEIERSEQSSGSYLNSCKKCQNSYFLSESEDCCNCVRGHQVKDALDSVGVLDSELIYLSLSAQDKCYDIRVCYNVSQSRNLQYSAHCHRCANCFACCGLVGKQFCVFNKEYSEGEYKVIVKEILTQIEEEGGLEKFFPGCFAANGYDESLAAVYFPLTRLEQEELGFRLVAEESSSVSDALQPENFLDDAQALGHEICQRVFWDKEAAKPFRIHQFDLDFAQKTNRPLPQMYYVRRLKNLLSMMPFFGEMRQVSCAETGEETYTNYPLSFHGQIFSEEAYLKKIVSSSLK